MHLFYLGSKKLADEVARITGGDSGIGRAVAILFAREGANIALAYLNEHDDARLTKEKVEDEGGKCLLIPGDVRSQKFCEKAVARGRQANFFLASPHGSSGRNPADHRQL